MHPTRGYLATVRAISDDGIVTVARRRFDGPGAPAAATHWARASASRYAATYGPERVAVTIETVAALPAGTLRVEALS